MLAFTVSTADASALEGRDAARSGCSNGTFTGFASWEGNSGNIDGTLTGDLNPPTSQATWVAHRE
ncbi:hypothetical protein [Streptomyces lanatus]|uniref:Uncharacterized protein n=1 Tax=Streptomyces lanatus TaxID=66900 RepID=A0ABV1Y3K5_9ACTN|nr:hypothetical protein [Streptomyces lanatus]